MSQLLFHMPSHPTYAQAHSSMGESSRSAATSSGPYLPQQVFSSPSDQKLYPASTLAAVEATRARFFARDAKPSSSARRSRVPQRKAVTAHALSSAGHGGSYRQSFYERCQQAMDQTRSSARTQRVQAFRKGQSEFTRGFFSDEAMDMDDDQSTPSSPGPSSSQEAVEEDDELTRRKIIAEYSRLKRIYELKGQLEIGWMHPDHVAWLEDEIREHGPQLSQTSSLVNDDDKDAALIDPLLNARDEELEQLWIHSQQQPLHPHDEHMADEYTDNDAAFEQALANLPY